MVPEARLAPRRTLIPIAHPRLRGYNPLDLITMGYFVITSIFLAIGLERVPHGWKYLLLHIAIVAGIAMLRFVPRRGNIFLQFMRDLYPLCALPLFYEEIGILNQALWTVPFDNVVINWEHALFGLFPSQQMREWMPSRILNEFFHFSYLMYYLLVPILAFWLYLRGRAEVCRVFATTLMLTFFTCYIIFILFPVAGPYYAFARPATEGWFFAPIVHRILDSGSSLGSAFPSSHVACSLTVFWMTARFEKPLVPLMAVLCVGIFFGTVYGGFHYAIDALAGVALAIPISIAGPRIHSWLLRRARLWPLRVRFPHLWKPVVGALWRFRPVRLPRLRTPHLWPEMTDARQNEPPTKRQQKQS